MIPLKFLKEKKSSFLDFQDVYKRQGEAMNELLNIPCGTVRVTDGIITYVGENRISHEKPGYKRCV